MSLGKDPRDRIETERDLQEKIAIEERQSGFFNSHPEMNLVPQEEFSATYSEARRLFALELEDLCSDMERILDGRVSMNGFVSGNAAELHGPNSVIGNGEFFFKSVEVAARLTREGKFDCWVPGGFSVVPISVDELREALLEFEKSRIQEP